MEAVLTVPAAGTAGAAYRELAGLFRGARLPTPELDARLLVCHVCGLTHEQFAAGPEKPIGGAAYRRLAQAARRRIAREPVSRIAGMREFWGLEFTLGAQTLDPRPDTETLVQAVLDLARERGGGWPRAILDLGTGSGCILVSLLHELTFAHGVGIDRNADALRTARSNAERHGVGARALFACTSWTDGLRGPFDLVVANPPYIRSGDVAELDPEVRAFDPPLALDGGIDGLDAYRAIVPALADLLSPGGWGVFEVGADQESAVSAMLGTTRGGLAGGGVRHWRDLAGRVRCVAANHSPAR